MKGTGWHSPFCSYAMFSARIVYADQLEAVPLHKILSAWLPDKQDKINTAGLLPWTTAFHDLCKQIV